MSAKKELEDRLGSQKSVNADEVLIEKDAAGNDLKEGDKVWYANGARDDSLREGTIIRATHIRREWDHISHKYTDNHIKTDYLAIKGVSGRVKGISDNCIKKVD